MVRVPSSTVTVSENLSISSVNTVCRGIEICLCSFDNEILIRYPVPVQYMITIIGTGHVFDISEPMMFFVKHIWPDAVLVELDVTRFNAMTAASQEKKDGEASEEAQKNDKDVPWIYRSTAKYQKKMAGDYGSNVGAEMLTAVNTGKLIGAEIGFIDSNAANVMNEVWSEMPFGEKARYTMSSLKDRVSGKKEVDRTVEEFSKNEDAMMADMRRKYPTLVRKLIDERNDHMAKEIASYADRLNNIVVVVGDAHVEGLAELLKGREIRKIRLQDILNKDRLDAVRRELWNEKGSE